MVWAPEVPPGPHPVADMNSSLLSNTHTYHTVHTHCIYVHKWIEVYCSRLKLVLQLRILKSPKCPDIYTLLKHKYPITLPLIYQYQYQHWYWVLVLVNCKSTIQIVIRYYEKGCKYSPFPKWLKS